MANSSGHRTIIIPPGSLNPNEVNVVYIPTALCNTTHPLLVRPATARNRSLRATPLPIWDDELTRADEYNEGNTTAPGDTSSPYSTGAGGPSGYEADISSLNTTQNVDGTYVSAVGDCNNNRRVCSNVTAAGTPNVRHMSSSMVKTSSFAPPERSSITIDAPQGVDARSFQRILANNVKVAGQGAQPVTEGTSPPSPVANSTFARPPPPQANATFARPPTPQANATFARPPTPQANATFAHPPPPQANATFDRPPLPQTSNPPQMNRSFVPPAGRGQQAMNWSDPREQLRSSQQMDAAIASRSPLSADQCPCAGDYSEEFDPLAESTFRSEYTPEEYYEDMWDSQPFDSSTFEEANESSMQRAKEGQYNIITPMTPSPTKSKNPPCPQSCPSWQNKEGGRCNIGVYGSSSDNTANTPAAARSPSGRGTPSTLGRSRCKCSTPPANASNARSPTSVGKPPADTFTRPPSDYSASSANSPAGFQSGPAANGTLESHYEDASYSQPFESTNRQSPMSPSSSRPNNGNCTATCSINVSGSQAANTTFPRSPSGQGTPATNTTNVRSAPPANTTYTGQPMDCGASCDTFARSSVGRGAPPMDRSYAVPPAGRGQQATNLSDPRDRLRTSQQMDGNIASRPPLSADQCPCVEDYYDDTWNSSTFGEVNNSTMASTMEGQYNVTSPMAQSPTQPATGPCFQECYEPCSTNTTGAQPANARMVGSPQGIDAGAFDRIIDNNRTVYTIGDEQPPNFPNTPQSAGRSSLQGVDAGAFDRIVDNNRTVYSIDGEQPPNFPNTPQSAGRSATPPRATCPSPQRSCGRTFQQSSNFPQTPPKIGQGAPPANATFARPPANATFAGPPANATFARPPANATFAGPPANATYAGSPAGSGASPDSVFFPRSPPPPRTPQVDRSYVAPPVGRGQQAMNLSDPLDRLQTNRQLDAAIASRAPLYEDECPCYEAYDNFDPAHFSSFPSLTPESYGDDVWDSHPYDSSTSEEMDDSAFAKVMGGEYNVITPMTPSPPRGACPPTCPADRSSQGQ